MFRKVELWLVLLLLLVGGLCAVLFAATVLRAERQIKPRSLLSSTALSIAEVPTTMRDLLIGQNRLVATNQASFAGKPGGWSFPNGPLVGPQGYLLLSRYAADSGTSVVELVSLPDMAVRYRWTPDHLAMVNAIGHQSPFSEVSDVGATYLREIHPVLLDDGSLIAKDHYSPLFQVTPCGRPGWIIDSEVFHHSSEVDADGNLWVGGIAEKHSLANLRYTMSEDQLTKVSPTARCCTASRCRRS